MDREVQQVPRDVNPPQTPVRTGNDDQTTRRATQTDQMDQTVDTAEQTQTPAVARTPEVADKSTYRATRTDEIDQTVDKSERNSGFRPVYGSKR